MSEESIKKTANKSGARNNKIFIAILCIFVGILLGSAAGWFSVYSSSLIFLSFVCGFFLLLVSFYKPLWGLLILMGFFLLPSLFYTEEITSLEIFWGMLFVAGFIGALSRALLGRKRLLLSFKKEVILWLTMFFLFWGAVSSLVSLSGGEPVIWWLRKYVEFIGYLLIFWVVWSIDQKNEKWVKILLSLFLFIGVAKGCQQLIYYYQVLPQAIALNNFQILRGRFYVEFFGFPSSILAMCLYIYSKKRTEKLLFALLAFFFLILLVLSFTRSMWMGFIVSFLILLFRFKRFRAKIAKIILSLFIVVIAAIGGGFLLRREIMFYLFDWVKVRLLSFLELEVQLSMLDRFAEWKALWSLSWKKPFFGYGIGRSFTFYSINPWSWAEEGGIGWVSIRYSHNIYLYLLYTMGIVGLLLFMMLIFSVIRKARIMQNESSEPFVKAYCAAIYSIFFGFLVTSITSPIFMGKANSVYIGLLIGIFAALNRKNILKATKCK